MTKLKDLLYLQLTNVRRLHIFNWSASEGRYGTKHVHEHSIEGRKLLFSVFDVDACFLFPFWTWSIKLYINRNN